jgi:hypothetical protein
MTASLWIIDENEVPFSPFAAIDAIDPGVTIAGVAGKPSVPYGTVVRAKHPTFGEGEFIYLQGVASTLVGSLVNYTVSTGVTSLTTASVGSIPRPVAVAMSANVSTTTFGWYQIAGSAVIKKTAVKVDPAVTHATNVYLSGTSGRIMQTSVAVRTVLGAAFETTTTITSTTSTAVVTINRPHQQGPII